MDKQNKIFVKIFSWFGILIVISLIIYCFYYGLTQEDSNWINVGVTTVLVSITAYYTYYTKILVNNTERQIRLSQNPVIGIKIHGFYICPEQDNGRRELSIPYSLENIGTHPAIEIFVDSEIELPKGNISGEKIIPARFEPDFIPYLKPNMTIPSEKDRLSQNYGNKLIHQLLVDYIGEDYKNFHPHLGSPRLWMDDEDLRKIKACITFYVYYRNSFSQYFESVLKVYVHVYKNSKNMDEYLMYQLNLTGQSFNSNPILKEKMENDIKCRNQKRTLCGW
jgi:hypothetical protein